MSVEENKALVRRGLEEWWKGNDILDETLHTDYIGHPGSTDIEFNRKMIASGKQAFSDVSVTFHDMIAEGDLVACRTTVRATHTGQWPGGPPPSGKRIEMIWLRMYRIVDGKIAESWALRDELSTAKQLGITPDMGKVQVRTWDD
jgi:predicted ester cyclase